MISIPRLIKNRKVFNFYNNLTHEVFNVHAAGILIYKVENNKVKVLLQQTLKYFEDFGGKTKDIDENVYQTAIREIKEETNKLFDINESRVENAPFVYNDVGKYLLFLVKADDIEKNYTSKLFDIIEKYKEEDNPKQYTKHDCGCWDIKQETPYNNHTLECYNETQLNKSINDIRIVDWKDLDVLSELSVHPRLENIIINIINNINILENDNKQERF